jgi:hypothetical protein
MTEKTPEEIAQMAKEAKAALTEKTLGQIAYEAALAHDGCADSPTWNEPWQADFKGAWEAAASAVRNAVLEEAAMVADDEAERTGTAGYRHVDAREDACIKVAEAIRALKSPEAA